MKQVLVAGIGNIFKGDDGFGVAVAQLLARREPLDGARVVDFGIRGLDLVYALLDSCDGAILIDTVRRGEAPGTLSIIEPEPGEADPDDMVPSPHEIDPQKVLRLAKALGCRCEQVLLVGCEPLSFGDDEYGAEGLTPPVAAAVGRAAELVETLVRELTLKEAA